MIKQGFKLHTQSYSNMFTTCDTSCSSYQGCVQDRPLVKKSWNCFDFLFFCIKSASGFSVVLPTFVSFILLNILDKTKSIFCISFQKSWAWLNKVLRLTNEIVGSLWLLDLNKYLSPVSLWSCQFHTHLLQWKEVWLYNTNILQSSSKKGDFFQICGQI